jgi:dimethylamine/trimethylamine dehydrogenase
MGVAIVTGRAVTEVRKGSLVTACAFTGRLNEMAADALVMVTARLPNESLTKALLARESEWAAAGLVSLKALGDAWAPSTIAAAVYAGRRYAEEFEAPPLGDALPFKREVTGLVAL